MILFLALQNCMAKTKLNLTIMRHILESHDIVTHYYQIILVIILDEELAHARFIFLFHDERLICVVSVFTCTL